MVAPVDGCPVQSARLFCAMDPIPVLLDRYATPNEIANVRAVFARTGREAMVRAVWEKPPQTGNGAFWMTLVLLAVPFKAFADGFFGKAGEDTWMALRKLVEELREARRGSTLADEGWVEFDDPDDTQVMLASGIPDEAYEALLELDWSAVRGGTIMWDEERGRWFDLNPGKRRGRR
jgi:hypothetical protein